MPLLLLLAVVDNMELVSGKEKEREGRGEESKELADIHTSSSGGLT